MRSGQDLVCGGPGDATRHRFCPGGAACANACVQYEVWREANPGGILHLSVTLSRDHTCSRHNLNASLPSRQRWPDVWLDGLILCTTPLANTPLGLRRCVLALQLGAACWRCVLAYLVWMGTTTHKWTPC
eukprot:354014-Chlamydomonas_euryale.AAC.4